MATVIVLEYGFRVINGTIYNSKMEPVSEQEYRSIVENKRKRSNEWQQIEVDELREILTNEGVTYLMTNDLIVGYDNGVVFVATLRQEFDGKTSIKFKLIELEELSYWLWKIDMPFNEKLEWLVDTFGADLELARIYEGFLISEFIHDGWIYRLVVSKDSEYLKIKKVAKAPSKANGTTKQGSGFNELLGL